MSEYIKLSTDKELDRVIAKALVGSEAYPSISDSKNPILVGFNGKEFVLTSTNTRFDVKGNQTEYTSDFVNIPYDSAILDPRLLIGTLVEFDGYGTLLASDDLWGYFDREFEETALLRHLKISKQWLADKSMLEGE